MRHRARADAMPARAYARLERSANMPHSEYARVARRAPRFVQVTVQLALGIILCGGLIVAGLAVVIVGNALIHR